MVSDSFECGGYRWRYHFLHGDSRLTDSERKYVVFQTADMHLAEEGTRRVVMDSLEGRITTTGKHQLLGTFGGQHYDAELETAQGKVKLAFLVAAPRDLEERKLRPQDRN